MIKSLKLTDKTSSRLAVRQVAKELFTDSQINWGRIVTLYAFVGELANYGEKSFAMDTKAGGYAKYIGEAVGEYVAEELTPWISKQGGWVSGYNFGILVYTSIYCSIYSKLYSTL